MNLRGILAGLAIGTLLLGSSIAAEAAPIVYVVQPGPVANGDAFSVDVAIQNLTESIGGFDLSVSWDDSILTLLGDQLDPDSNFANTLSYSVAAASSIDLGIAGDPVNQNAALDPFTLFTLTFEAAAIGTSPINITFSDLSSADGFGLIAHSTQDATACVVDDPTAPVNCQPVPEPGLVSLISAGLAATVARRRRTSHRA